MAVFRVEKNKNYTTMANYHFLDNALSWKAKGILSSMLSLPENWDYSLAGLVTLSSDGMSATRSAIKELEDRGYLIRRPLRKDGKIYDWEYLIFEKPQTEDQDIEKPVVEKPVVDFQQIENRTQLNTNKSSTKESSTKESNTERINKSDTVLANNTAKKNTPKSTIFEDYANGNKELLSALLDFEEYRKKIKKPMTDKAKELLLNNLKKLSSNANDQIKIINQSILNGWVGVFPLKGDKKNQQNNAYNYNYGEEGVDYL